MNCIDKRIEEQTYKNLMENMRREHVALKKVKALKIREQSINNIQLKEIKEDIEILNKNTRNLKHEVKVYLQNIRTTVQRKDLYDIISKLYKEIGNKIDNFTWYR